MTYLATLSNLLYLTIMNGMKPDTCMFCKFCPMSFPLCVDAHVIAFLTTSPPHPVLPVSVWLGRPRNLHKNAYEFSPLHLLISRSDSCQMPSVGQGLGEVRAFNSEQNNTVFVSEENLGRTYLPGLVCWRRLYWD